MKATAKITLNIGIFGGRDFDKSLYIAWWDVEWFPSSITADDVRLELLAIHKLNRPHPKPI